MVDETVLHPGKDRLSIQPVLTFLLTFIVLLSGLSYFVYAILIGEWSTYVSFSQLVNILWQSILPMFTGPVLAALAIVFIFVKHRSLKLFLSLGVLIIASTTFLSGLPGGLGGVGLSILFAINLCLILISLVAVFYFDWKSRLDQLRRYNVILGFIIILLLIVNIAAVLNYTMTQRDISFVEREEYENVQMAVEVCEDISDRSSKRDCLATIAVQQTNITLCAGLVYPGQNLCVEQVAGKANDPSICNDLERPTDGQFFSEATWANDRRMCGFVAVGNQTDTAICDDVQDSLVKGTCLRAIAVNDPQIATCMLIESYTWRGEPSMNTRDQCLVHVIPEVGTLQDCELISRDTWSYRDCVRYMSD